MSTAVIDAHILVIDDDEDVVTSIRLLLKQYFRKVSSLRSPTNLMSFLSQNTIDLILLDMNYHRGESEGLEGLKWISRIKENYPAIAIIPMTAYADVQLAVTAVKKGATDFIIKPWQNQKLMATISAALQLQRSRQEIALLRAQRTQVQKDLEMGFSAFIGESEAISGVKHTIEKIAPTDASILISGENGTGKEVVARTIHRRSLRNQGPFISIDLGAVAESLFESELFGYKKGAFTDAKQDKVGRFELANNGTLFLDEIGNLSQGMQVKLLGALQNRKITPLGSGNSKSIDVRIVSATNTALHEAIEHGAFRKDLYYRINTVEIVLPPLRERRRDIGMLAEHFLKLYQHKYQKQGLRFSSGDIRLFEQYEWPGNVRELQHAVERMVILSPNGQLDSQHFLLPKRDTASKPDTLNLETIEKETILTALERCKGNISKAAKALGITRMALYRRLEKYDI